MVLERGAYLLEVPEKIIRICPMRGVALVKRHFHILVLLEKDSFHIQNNIHSHFSSF